MQTINEPKKEQEAVKLMLYVLERACLRLEAGEKIDSRYLLKILAFFQGWEIRNGFYRSKNLIKSMSLVLSQYQKGADQSSKAFVHNARMYIALQKQYQKGGTSLSGNNKAQQTEAGYQEKKFEQIIIREIKRRKKEEFLKNLKGIYLVD